MGALVDDNLFERDILVATKKLVCLSNLSERIQGKTLVRLATALRVIVVRDSSFLYYTSALKFFVLIFLNDYICR